MTALNREVAQLGEYSDDAHNGNGQAVTPGRSVTGVAPSSVVVSTPTQITVNGTGFIDGNDIHVDGGPALATTFVSATQLRASVTATAAGPHTVTVGGASGTATLTATATAGTQAAPEEAAK